MTLFTLVLPLVLSAPAVAQDPSAQDPPSNDPRGPGTRKMAARLEEIAANADPEATRIQSAERAALYAKRLGRATGTPREPDLRVKLATELMQSGQPFEATEELDRAEQAHRELHGELDPGFAHELDRARAIAWLRLGEQENCIGHHGCESCIMPIGLGGRHRETRGSEQAIRWYTKLVLRDPTDLESRWLLNLAHMTLGTWPDGVPEAFRLDPKVFESEQDIGRFKDVAPALGLDIATISGGAVLEDFDGDGFIDLVVTSIGLRDPMRFFRNRGDGTFVERTREAGLEGEVGGLNMIHADYDNDGDPDIYVIRGAWLGEQGLFPDSLLRNNGDGTFEDVTEAAGLLAFHPSQTAQWADFDNDGWLDLVVGNETQKIGDPPHPCELYWNQQDGTFENVAAKVGVDRVGFVKGVAVGDYDNDDRVDLYYSIRNDHNVLYRNEPRAIVAGGGPPFRFRDVTGDARVAQPRMSFPTWFFDYNNDGWLDLFVATNSGFTEKNLDDIGALYAGGTVDAELPRLYLNEKNGRFREVSHEMRVDRSLLSMGSNYCDLDNDGWLDFYLGNGAPDFRALLPNRMFRNDNGRGFRDVTTSGGFGHLQKGHAVAVADVDNDGDQDIFLEVGGFFTGDVYPNVLYENPGHGNHWVTLQLVGVKANRSAIGARIRVDVTAPSGDRSLHLVCGTGGSFGSSSLQQEIGLGDATAIRRIEIRWPGSGTLSTFEAVAMDRFWRATEGQAELAPIAVKSFKLGGAARESGGTGAVPPGEARSSGASGGR